MKYLGSTSISRETREGKIIVLIENIIFQNKLKFCFLDEIRAIHYDGVGDYKKKQRRTLPKS